MDDVMIDLETLGTAPGCSILSIGAVGFDYSSPELTGAEFHAIIDRSSCKASGLKEDSKTLEWWGKQSEEAKATLVAANCSGKPLYQTLWRFDRWLSGFALAGVRVWGNGADFDLPILAAAYEAVGMTTPWGAYHGRCYRTLKNLRQDIKIERTGTYHNALDDARNQAKHACAILRKLYSI